MAEIAQTENVDAPIQDESKDISKLNSSELAAAGVERMRQGKQNEPIEQFAPSSEESTGFTTEFTKPIKHSERMQNLMRNGHSEEDAAVLISEEKMRKANIQKIKDSEKIEEEKKVAAEVLKKEQSELDRVIAARDFEASEGGDTTPHDRKIAILQKSIQDKSGAAINAVEEQAQAVREPAVEKEPEQIVAENALAAEEAQTAKEEENLAISQQRERDDVKVKTQNEIDKIKMEFEKATKELQAENETYAQMQDETFWGSASTGTKIMAGIAMFIGAAATGTSIVKDLIMGDFERNIKVKKLDQAQALAYKQAGYKKIEMKLKIMESQVSNTEKLGKLKILQDEARAEQQKLKLEREALKKRNYTKNQLVKGSRKLESMTPEEINTTFDKEDFKRAKGLRDEYSKQTEKLGTREVINSYRDVMSMASSGSTGKTDIALLTKFMKTLDPGSVVREGEFHIAADASPALRAVVTKMKGLVTGEKLAPEDRKEFGRAVQKLLGPKLKTQHEVNRRYNSLSRQYGLPSSLIVEDFDLNKISPRTALIEQQTRKSSRSRDQIEQSIDKLVKSGKLPEKFLD